jgi:hypothetical protein
VKKSSYLPRIRIFIYVLAAVSIILFFFWGEFGFFRVWILHRKMVKLEKEIVKYAVENYGYARPDQKIIQFVPMDTTVTESETQISE